MAASTQRHRESAPPSRAAPPPPPPPREPAPLPPPSPVKLLSQFGSMAKDVLYGNKSEGLFGTAGTSKFALSSSTSNGVTLSTTATTLASPSAGPAPLSGQVLAAYTSRDGAVLGDLLLTSRGVAEATFSRGFFLPASWYGPSSSSATNGGDGSKKLQNRTVLKPGRVVVGGVVSLPGLADPGQVLPPKLTLDYAGTYVHTKSSSTLAAKPLLTAAAVAGAGRVALGGEAVYSTSAGRVTRWSAAAAWHDARQHVGLNLSAGGTTATLLYGYSLQPGVTLGVEAVADVASLMPSQAKGPATGGGEVAAAAAVGKPRVPPIFSVGASFRLPPPPPPANDNGEGSSKAGSGGSCSRGVVKVKVASSGVVSLLYRDTLMAGPRVTLTAQLDGLDLTKGPKLGLAMDV